MFTSGKCPKCEKVISHVRIEHIPIKEGMQDRYRGVSYCCPWCNTVLSVGVDPHFLNEDIIDKLKR